jgi:hypothetical protein
MKPLSGIFKTALSGWQGLVMDGILTIHIVTIHVEKDGIFEIFGNLIKAKNFILGF